MTDFPIIYNKDFSSEYNNYKEKEVIKITPTDILIFYFCENPNKNYKWINIIHQHCREMKIKNIGEYNVICCGGCNLRVTIPKKITTIEQLKKYFKDKDSDDKIQTRAEILDL